MKLLEITAEELLKLEADAEEFDGFYSWIVLKKIVDGENDLQENNFTLEVDYWN